MKNLKVNIQSIQLIAAFCLMYSVAFSQKEKPKNLPNYDKKLLHFGFSLGINSGNSIIKYNPDAMLKDSLLSLEPTRIPGFGLGIVTNFQFADNFDLRFIPSLSFLTRQYDYRFCVKCKQTIPTDTLITKTVESTQLDFPLSIKFKSERVNNYRWYMLAGMKYSMDLASNKDVNTAATFPLRFQKTDLAYEVGLGLDFYLNYFKFSPELKLSMGTKNMLVKDNTAFSNPIQSLKTKTFYISFLFE